MLRQPMIYGRAVEQQHEPANEEIYQDLCLVGVCNRHEAGELRKRFMKKQPLKNLILFQTILFLSLTT